MTELDSLWPHFAKFGTGPTMVRGEGSYVYDSDGKRYFDALASLYCVNVGHGRREIADAVSRQIAELEYYPVWGSATPTAGELARRMVELAPEGFSRVFFTSGGSDSVDGAWKLVRQYHRLRGNFSKTKIIAREGAYHGTTLGALSVTGVPTLREPFLPLVPGAVHVPKVKPFRSGMTAEEHSLWAAEQVANAVEAQGPDTVGAVIVEPVQNAGGCLVAEPGYFRRLREICDQHDLLLISDETICSWGRIGTSYGCEVFNYVPDIITTAKGLTSGYVPMGAIVTGEKVARAFVDADTYFNHGLTFGGHPVAAAAGLANLDILRDEELGERAVVLGAHFRDCLEGLSDLPIFGEARGVAMFQAIELVGDQATMASFTVEQTQALVEYVPAALRESGIICRAMHRGAPVIQFAPPLVASKDDISELVEKLREVLTGALEVIA